jgi:SAM-dependent methyltransferase
MPDPLADSFDALPYRHGAVAESHPARIGAIARLLGQEAAAPDCCRVLELGCGEGMNLLPLAERLPKSQFVGVDFSPRQIEVGEKARQAAKLENAQLICADLRTYEVAPGAFDYVIAHGVYSWVPDEVKDRLLAICARALAPAGVAYVFYNVHPASGLIGGLRAILRADLAGAADPVSHVARLLPTLERAFAAQTGPHAALMRAALAEMQSKSPALLFHDELERLNDPTTFLEFNAHAGKHGLHYLAEAHFASLPFDHLSAAVREALGNLELDFFRSQQLLDLLGYRRVRNSLLTVSAVAAERKLNLAAIPECTVRLRLWPADGRIDLTPDVPARLQGRHEFHLSVEKPAQKAFFAALCEARPGGLPFPAALSRAAELLRQTGQPDTIDAGLLAAGIARLFTIDQCDLLLTGDGEWLRVSESPAPTPLMRHQAAHDLAVTNRWHENVELTTDERRWLAGEAVTVNEAALLRSGLGV